MFDLLIIIVARKHQLTEKILLTLTVKPSATSGKILKIKLMKVLLDQMNQLHSVVQK